MKKNAPYYSLLRFYVVTLIVMTTLCYVLLFFQLKAHQQKTSLALFHDITDDLAHQLDELNSDDIHDVAFSHADNKGLTYRLMLITPDDQTLIHTHHHPKQKDEPLFVLPYWQPTENQKNSYDIDSQELIGWMNLSDGYQAYVQILHPPMAFNWQNPMYWLPILLALLLFLICMMLLLTYKSAWRQIINYANTFPTKLNDPYTLLNEPEIGIGQEFRRLTHSLNRINQQLHLGYRRLHAVNKRLHRLTDHSPLPLLMIGRGGQITFFNRRFEQAFMTAFQEDVSYYLTDFLTGKDKLTQHHLTQLGELKTNQTFMVSSLDNNQDYLLSIQPILGNQSQVQGFYALLTEITSFTTELKEIDIKIGQQADKLVEFNQLWSVLGHELRTPLSGMIGLLELMSTDNFNSEQHDTYQTLNQTSQSMLGMLNDMLDAAKMEAGKLQVVIERVDIFELCHQVMDLMASNARQQGIELLIHFESDCPRYLDTDVGRLRQSLMNLIGNAIKFTQEGYVGLEVNLMRGGDGSFREMSKEAGHPTLSRKHSGWLCFSVKDTGIGISEADKSKLFSHFNQANDSISRQFGGTGLGLAISNNFAQFLGGFIHVDSVLGQGSEFSLCLPYDVGESAQIYDFKTDFSHFYLFAFCYQEFSAKALRTLCEVLGIHSVIQTEINQSCIESIGTTDLQDKTPIILMDNELYTHHNIPELIEFFPFVDEATKLLFSMSPEADLPPERLLKFDGYLSKPLNINDLLAQITHLSQEDIGQKGTSFVEQAYFEFMQSIELKGLNHNNESSLEKLPLLTHITFTKAHDQYSILNAPYSKHYIKYHLQNPEVGNNSLNHHLILVAEDNPVNQKVVSKLLQKMGYPYLIANHGEEALSLLSIHNVDLILMDCRMPVMDGFETTKRIRSSQNSLPIVALTAGDTDADRKACLDAGMNAFLSKPIKKDALEAILAKFMI